MKTPFFVPFNIRNQIINENCTKLKDIEEFETKDKYSTLTSYMKEKEINNGIDNRIGKVFYSKARANFTVSNSIDDFKKGHVKTRFELMQEMGI
jgi:hypothetical protein